MYIHHECKFIWVHVQKTGGTFFKRTFRKRNLQRIGEKHGSIHSIHDEIESKYKNYLIFGLVRNPYTRLASAYRYNKDRRIFNIKKQTRLCDIPNVEPMECTVEEFIDWYNKADCMVQSKYFYENNPNQFIGKYDNLREYIGWVFNKVGLDYKVGKRNYKTLFFGHYNCRDYLSNEAIQMINEICDEDFKRFGYKKVQFLNEI